MTITVTLVLTQWDWGGAYCTSVPARRAAKCSGYGRYACSWTVIRRWLSVHCKHCNHITISWRQSHTSH